MCSVLMRERNSKDCSNPVFLCERSDGSEVYPGNMRNMQDRGTMPHSFGVDSAIHEVQVICSANKSVRTNETFSTSHRAANAANVSGAEAGSIYPDFAP